MSFIVKRVDPIDTVAQQAVQFEIDQLFEPPSFYFPTAEPGGQYQSCQLFQRKQCFKGDRCPYRHINDRVVLCKHWIRGLCKKGDSCEFLHEYDLQRMPECQFMKTHGECLNPDCTWRHIIPEDKSFAKACIWYERGFCRHGPKCRHKHVKKEVCVNWLAGFCPVGPSCDKGHPVPDLDSIMPNSHAANANVARHPSSQQQQFQQHQQQQFQQHQQQQQQRAAGVPQASGGVRTAADAVRCYQCQGFGHMARDCPHPPRR